MQPVRSRSNPVAGRVLAGPLSDESGIGRLHSARPGPGPCPVRRRRNGNAKARARQERSARPERAQPEESTPNEPLRIHRTAGSRYWTVVDQVSERATDGPDVRRNSRMVRMLKWTGRGRPTYPFLRRGSTSSGPGGLRKGEAVSVVPRPRKHRRHEERNAGRGTSSGRGLSKNYACCSVFSSSRVCVATVPIRTPSSTTMSWSAAAVRNGTPSTRIRWMTA